YRNRILSVAIANVTSKLLLLEIYGEDYLAYPYFFQLRVLAKKFSQPLDTLLKRRISIRLACVSNHAKYYHGHIYRLTEICVDTSGYAEYEIIMTPWLTFLEEKKLSQNHILAKPLSVPEIICNLFAKKNYYNYRLQLNNAYAKLNICIQYKESYLNFIQRLLFDAGIYYFFVHSSTTHTLILTDALKPKIFCKLNHNHHLNQNAISNQNTYTPELTVPQITDWQTHIDEQIQPKIFFSARSQQTLWQPGSEFTWAKTTDAREKNKYYIHAIAHIAKDYSNALPQKQKTLVQYYQNYFLALPSQIRFKPHTCFYHHQNKVLKEMIPKTKPRFKSIATYKPHISNVEIATVMDLKATNKHTHVYKIRFHWNDNLPQAYHCAWVTLLAGNPRGIQALPSKGVQVLVSFTAGDPNQPTILQMLAKPTAKLPFNNNQPAMQSGWKSRCLNKHLTHPNSSGHYLKFNDAAKSATVDLYSNAKLTCQSQRQHQINVKEQMIETVKTGHFIQMIEGKLKIISKTAIYIINNQSLIRLRPKDISFIADEIHISGDS
ncbi:MAG: contractile injection system protein, VgrG/Pvc8 family, partial [Pseudomonadota bacterium]